MTEARPNWLDIASDVTSFRQMYRLATEIVESSAATSCERCAAERVVGSLRDVIDAPIAEAATLAEARKQFGGLVRSLQLAA
ncbi:hypothetical protein [Rhizobium tumorigenes]|uniref:hypothetical protein n=1 Tax=Rhizobium tumorigenes TaxID=2041385 RepID=UPI00241E9445|nr:hypothetical protein [Rhizobium tumorigenes]WFS01984.1 hypothetical protein PR016_05000 [Rhizobium tumorigenes]